MQKLRGSQHPSSALAAPISPEKSAERAVVDLATGAGAKAEAEAIKEEAIRQAVFMVDVVCRGK